jgi:diguanylate cyclase (GGDEF)-like protein
MLRLAKNLPEPFRVMALRVERFASQSAVWLVLALLALVFAAAIDLFNSKATPHHIAGASVRFLSETSETPDPEAISSKFQNEGSSRRAAAERFGAKGYWTQISFDADQLKAERALELRLRNITTVKAWTREGFYGRLLPVLQPEQSKGGVSIRLPRGTTEALVYIRTASVVPPKVLLWDAQELHAETLRFERAGGGLVAALVLFSAFGLIVGLVNRDTTFLFFSAWLITTLRVAAVNGGWDFSWFGIEASPEVLQTISRATLALHGALTGLLFRSLFKADLYTLDKHNISYYLTWSFSLQIPLALWLQHGLFMQMFWTCSVISIVLLMGLLIRHVWGAPSLVGTWYLLSWASLFAGILAEVAHSSGLLSFHLPLLNTQTGAIASALLTGIALSERIRTEREARIHAQQKTVSVLREFKRNYNSMPVGLFRATFDGRLTLYNPAFSSMFSVSQDEHISPTLDELLGDGVAEKLKAASKSDHADVELQLTVGNEDRWFLARVTGRDSAIEGSIQDITARKHAEAQLRHLVDHDSLTGLLNHRGLEVALGNAVDAHKKGTSSAVACVDMDHFKIVNDLHGHRVGDALLQKIASRLSSSIRMRDSVARIGDSFVVVFFDCPDQAVTILTERLRQEIANEQFFIEGRGLRVTVSIGIVLLDNSMTPLDAMSAADRACREAKARGRNCVVRLNEQDAALKNHLEELKVVADLQQPPHSDRFFLEFQPIIAMRAPASTLAYEVLLRMRGEAGAVIPPGKFIGAAERNGMMSQIDRWVLRSTLEWLARNPEHLQRLTFATVNISGASLNDSRFVDDAFAMIAEHPRSMSKVCFEITESVALHDLGSTRRFVDRVRSYGTKLALDDFGAGYTSFNYLKEIPADYIKIDGTFVRDINRNPANFAITRTIVDLTHELGMCSIAEWVETPDTVASLIELNVDYGQGYGLARPMAPERLLAVLSSGDLVRDPSVQELLGRSLTSST